MLSWLRGLLARETAHLASARRSGDAALAEAFCSSEFWFLSLPAEFDDGISTSATTEEALSYIRRAAEDLADRESFEVFTYPTSDGVRMLPLFTSQDAVQPFVQAYVNERRKAIPFQALRVPGHTLAGGLGRYGGVVVNPRCRGELTLSPAEVRAIAARTT